MIYPFQNSTQPSVVSLALASRGLAPCRVQPSFAREAARRTQDSQSLLPVAGIVVRAVAIAALLVAAVASIGSEPTRSEKPAVVALA
jgi:hypothetical protein